MKKKWRAAALAVAAVLSWLAWSLCRQAEDLGRLLDVVLAEPVSQAQVQTMLEQEGEAEEPLRFCFWGRGRKQLVSCQETGREAQVTPLYLAGHPALMDCPELTWQTGCLVDGATAQALFGTDQCSGQSLVLEGRQLPVLGILPSPQPTLVTLAPMETTLENGVLEGTKAQAGQALVRWGLGGELLDHSLVLAMCRNFLLLFPGALTLGLCRKLWKRGRRGRAGAAALAVGFFCLLAVSLEIPEEMIPSQWSDLEFWSRWWQSRQAADWTAALTQKHSRQLQMLANVVKSTISSIGACLLALWAMGRENHADIAH